MYIGLFFKICVKGCVYWKYYILRVVLPSFMIFFRLLCLKDPINHTWLGVKLLHDYLFRVEKERKYLSAILV